MSAIRIPKPGSEFGPCETPCSHTDCGASRREAAALCTICGKPIGFDVLHYNDGPGQSKHWNCAFVQARNRK